MAGKIKRGAIFRATFGRLIPKTRAKIPFETDLPRNLAQSSFSSEFIHFWRAVIAGNKSIIPTMGM